MKLTREKAMAKQLVAFHGDANIKAKYIDRVKAHAIADEIIHGQYWSDGKGCAVGCTIHGAEHERYETELGVPRILARLEDRIFEGMENGHAKEFPLRFLTAIEPGADLSGVWYQFAHWLLVDPNDGVLQYAKTDRTRQAINEVAELYARVVRGETVEWHEWASARQIAAAYAADAYADAYAYAYAAYAADAAAAAYAYAYAAYAADAAAAYAAYAADAAAAYAADAYADAYAYAYAAYAADAAYAAYAARRRYSSSRATAFKRQADKLIELLAAAPVPSVAVAA